MKTVDEVWRIIDATVAPLEARRVPLDHANGLILREAVLAPEDMPAFSRSAIDGYLLAAGSPPGRYCLMGETRPGNVSSTVPASGEAVKIFTGSAVPERGAGLVMLEDVDLSDGEIVTRVDANERMIRNRGSQARKGDVLLGEGAALTAGALALLASVGCATPLVSSRVRAAHIVTGSEIVAVNAEAGEGVIRDSNSPLIAALLKDAGGEGVFHARVTESVEESVIACRDAESSHANLYLISGGASVGEHDGTTRVLEQLGFEIHFSKMKSRPGKPMIFGTRGADVAFGLPGNPLSHFVCFQLFVRRAIDRLMGRDSLPLVRVAIDGVAPKPDPRETWWPARVSGGGGALCAEPLPWKDSSDLTGLARANALLRISSEPWNGLVEAVIFDTLAG